jgi:hypothetical protein
MQETKNIEESGIGIVSAMLIATYCLRLLQTGSFPICLNNRRQIYNYRLLNCEEFIIILIPFDFSIEISICRLHSETRIRLQTIIYAEIGYQKEIECHDREMLRTSRTSVLIIITSFLTMTRSSSLNQTSLSCTFIIFRTCKRHKVYMSLFFFTGKCWSIFS